MPLHADNQPIDTLKVTQLIRRFGEKAASDNFRWVWVDTYVTNNLRLDSS